MAIPAPSSTQLSFFVILLFLPAPLRRAATGDRRALHEPLVPINWNAPPAPLLDAPANPPPQPPDPPATGVVTPANPANISALAGSGSRHASAGVRNTVVGVAVTVTLLGVLAASVLLLYRRLRRGALEPEKLVAGGHARPPSGRLPAAAPEVLYLGTVAPATRGGEQRLNGSPYRKLGSPAAAPQYQPSPELRPLPPLAPQPRPAAMLSDDDVYYTPKRSAPSAVSGSPTSVATSRQSPAAAAGKDISVCVVDGNPKSRRSSPRSRLSNSSSSDVKRVVALSPKAPPPPPPPPPPPVPKHERPKIPPPKPIPPITKELAADFPVPVRQSSSRRQWAKPASRADVPVPVAEKPLDELLDEKPKLKPLHWDKVRASSDREMVWDQLKSSSFQLDEDMFASLFCNPTNGAANKEAVRRPAVPPLRHDSRIIDARKSQNIAILLRALNVTTEEVTEALLEGNPEGLGADLLETLVKMAPTKEEELRLRDYAGDVSKLGSAERFLKAVLDIPFAFRRVDAILYRANFDAEVDYLRKSFKTLEVACEELKGSRLFLKLLEAVLRTGNRVNVGTNRGEAKAFKLDSLLKLADVKGVDGKTTLLHFVVQEIIRSEDSSSDHAVDSLKEDDFRKQGLKVVAGLGKELCNVKAAAGMDADVLSSYVAKLESGLDKIKSVLQLGSVSTQGRFFESTRAFLGEAEEGISRIRAEERTTLALVKEITEYFHGDATREEAHPFRIFMVVRDFLSMLGNVCREVERMQAVVGSARSFRMPTSASLPVLSRLDSKRGESSGDDTSSS